MFYGIAAAVMTLALVIVLSGSSVRERKDTAKNVALLVEEAQKNREVLCLAVVRNPANAARGDARLLDLCREVGVEP